MNATPFDISVVPACYDVSRYLPAFFASLEAQQGVDFSRVEVVAVDDGSNDDTLQALRAWAERSPLRVTVLTKENGGQGSARNLGMSVAQGRWITFVDPDDTLDPDYFATVLAFVEQHPETEMVATTRWLHAEESGEVTDTHPLHYMFTDDVLVDLDQSDRYFHGSAPASFLRTDRLRESGLQFDHDIRPNFEDGHFCTRYLLECERPMVGFIGSTRYLYLKRSDRSSTLNTSVAQPTRYTVVPRSGYLDVLTRSAAKQGGRPAGWVQNFVLYELSWYFSAEATMSGSQTAATGDVARAFLDTLSEIIGLLDPQRVEGFNFRHMDSVWRDVLLHGVAGETWHAPYAVIGPRDRGKGLIRVIVRFTGPEPRIEYLVNGEAVEPLHTKVRSHVYFDHDLVQERLSWLPEEGLEVRVERQVCELLRRWPRPDHLPYVANEPIPPRLRRWARNPGRAARSAVRRATRRLLTSPLVRGPYRDAWLLMDRIHDADDSGEHLFSYLRESRRDINAWFVLEKGTPDWKRLKPVYGRRLVAHGSLRWLALMLNCLHLVSSHVDKPIHRPERVMVLLKGRRATWRFSFLQHGVIKDDLSRWLNPKAVHVFVVSTQAEYDSVAGDRTQYVYTSRETMLTGLPRFDRLRAAAERIGPEQRDLILVTPTWRHWLMPALQEGSQRRQLHDDFLETDYAQQWLGFLTSERLAKVAEEHGLKVGFLPHPNLQTALSWLDLPAHVLPLTFSDHNAQELFARAAVLVTDYSSMAFNAAYLDRPVVYFQFDAEAMKSGAHVGRAGYFDYERDGFGPVVHDVEGALGALEGLSSRRFLPDEVHARRTAETFVLRDGRCCERAAQAIEAMGVPR